MATPQHPVSRLSLFRRGNGFLAFIPVAIALFFGIYAAIDGRKADRIGEGGAVATATITDKFFGYEQSTINGATRTTSNKIYTLRFRFPNGNEVLTSDSDVSEKYYDKMEIGDEAQVRFWRDDPSINEIEPGATRKSLWITKLLSAAFLAGGGYLIYFMWQRAGRPIRVRDHGERRTALVTEHRRTGVSQGEKIFFKLIWRDSEGVEGKSLTLPGHDLEATPIGAEITVYADPQGNLPSAWEGDVGRPARRT